MDLTQRFAGRNVLVVGGGAEGSATAMGNGRAIAIRLAQEGARVVVTDRDLERARDTVALLPERRGVALQSDALDVDQCRALFGQAEAAVGDIGVVIGNVGITGSLPGRTQTVEDWELINQVNVRSHWLVAQAALPAMIARGGGVFVFVSSIAGLIASGSSLSYEASKAALMALSRHYGVRYAERGIRSNAIALGVIDSAMVHREYGDDADRSRARNLMQPMNRQGRPTEAAAAAAFLASEDASFITGQCLVVDGGRTVDGRYDARYRRALAPVATTTATTSNDKSDGQG